MSVDAMISLFESSEILRWSAGLFLFNLVLTAIEMIADRMSGRHRRWKDTAANVAIFAIGQWLERTAFGAIIVVGLLPFYLYLSPIDIPMTTATWIFALLAADFTYYWMHRIEHDRRILWASHSVHHSSQDFNLSVAMRLCVVEGAIEWVFLIPRIVVGFNPFQAIMALVLVAQYQSWIHTEHIGRLGWLEGVLNTPSSHRVHHGSNPRYLDRNFGGILMIWDRLFGTWQAEDEPVVYGLTRNIDTHNPVTINFIEFRQVWREIKHCKRGCDRWKILIGPLNASPKSTCRSNTMPGEH